MPTQIEQRITDLLGLANLQDTAIEGFTPSDYELDYNGTVVSTFPATLVSDYNWVFVRVLVGSQEEYTMFKPSVSTTGVGIDLPLIQKDVFAQIKRVNGDFNFALYKKADNTLSPTTASVRMWGIKLDGINATEVDYDNSTSGLVADKVQGAIDELESKKVDKTSIVDNLTTDDTTKVLSAKQGKVLQDKLKDIGLDTPIEQLNNHTLREVFEGAMLPIKIYGLVHIPKWW